MALPLFSFADEEGNTCEGHINDEVLPGNKDLSDFGELPPMEMDISDIRGSIEALVKDLKELGPDFSQLKELREAKPNTLNDLRELEAAAQAFEEKVKANAIEAINQLNPHDPMDRKLLEGHRILAENAQSISSRTSQQLETVTSEIEGGEFEGDQPLPGQESAGDDGGSENGFTHDGANETLMDRLRQQMQELEQNGAFPQRADQPNLDPQDPSEGTGDPNFDPSSVTPPATESKPDLLKELFKNAQQEWDQGPQQNNQNDQDQQGQNQEGQQGQNQEGQQGQNQEGQQGQNQEGQQGQNQEGQQGQNQEGQQGQNQEGQQGQNQEG
ncbi:MAG: hypothetical protein AAF203_08185, partial [Pseudomonadota bacterium]